MHVVDNLVADRTRAHYQDEHAASEYSRASACAFAGVAVAADAAAARSRRMKTGPALATHTAPAGRLKRRLLPRRPQCGEIFAVAHAHMPNKSNNRRFLRPESYYGPQAFVSVTAVASHCKRCALAICSACLGHTRATISTARAATRRCRAHASGLRAPSCRSRNGSRSRGRSGAGGSRRAQHDG